MNNPCNALIERYSILVSEQFYNCLCISLDLKLEGGGLVTFTVRAPFVEDYNKNQFAYAVKRIMDIVGVYELKNIVGKPVRAKFEGEKRHFGSLIIGIGNFLDDEWFIPREEKLWKDD